MPADATSFVEETGDYARDLELDQRPADVVAIGSQLAYGRVGLNASLPVYEGHGLRVGAIPATILSVLPHYPSVHQIHSPAEWIVETLDDLALSGALDQLCLMSTGFLSNPGQADAIASWYVESGRTKVPLVVDPTFGDIGLGFYNDPALVDSLRDTLVPLATGLTPNLFELAHLAHSEPTELNDVNSVADAARSVLSPNSQWIVVTGLRSGSGLGEEHEGTISELVVTHQAAQLFTHPLLQQTPAGVGDTFTAALNSQIVDGKTLADAVELAAVETARHIRGGAQ